MSTFIALLIVLVTFVAAQLPPQIHATAILPPGAQITVPPSAEALELKKRDFTAVCGYQVTATPLWSYYCATGYYCGFNSQSAAFGCCGLNTANNDLIDCYYPTTCANFGQISTRNSVQVWETHSCTDSNYPYCATMYESGLSAMGCNSWPNQTVLLQFTLPAGFVTPSTSSTSSISIASLTDGGGVPTSSINIVGLSTTFNTFSNLETPSTAVTGPTTSSSAFSVTQASGSTTAPTTSSQNNGVRGAKDGGLTEFMAFIIGLVLQGL